MKKKFSDMLLKIFGEAPEIKQVEALLDYLIELKTNFQVEPDTCYSLLMIGVPGTPESQIKLIHPAPLTPEIKKIYSNSKNASKDIFDKALEGLSSTLIGSAACLLPLKKKQLQLKCELKKK